MISASQKMMKSQNRLLLLQQQQILRFQFSRLGKHEKMIKQNPHVKDFTINPIIKANVEEARNQFKRDNIVDGIKLLSEASQRSKKEIKLGKEIKIDNKKITKEVKKFTNKAIDKAHSDSYDYLVDNDYLQLNMSKIEENKRLIQELKEFKKLYFEKKEIKRLLKNQSRKPENYLPHTHLGSKDINHQQRFLAYQSSSNNLKNSRIHNMLEGNSKENQKLSLLISSGLLDTTKNIKQIISKSTELLQSDYLSKVSSLENHDNLYQEVIIDEQKLQENNETNQENQNENEQQDVTFADNMIIQQNNNNNNLSGLSEQDEKSKKLSIYGEKIAQMGFDITLDELNFVDFEVLSMFFDEFVNSTPEEKMRTLNKMQIIENLRSYENYLFDYYRNNDLSLRVKGRLEFKDLTEKENLNYIKYNIHKPSELFLMMSNLPEQSLTPSIVSQTVSKIASFKFKSKDNYLAVISNYNYRALLRHCINYNNQMSNHDFVDMIWSLGKIHKDEHGIVYEKLFHKLMSTCKSAIPERIKSIGLKEISFMSRGYLKLHHLALNKDLNEIVMKDVKEKLESKQGEELTIFGIQGLMLLMSFINTNESKQILSDYLLPLLHKPNILNELDNVSLSEICQSLASLTSTHKKEINQYLDISKDYIISISKQLSTDTISDLMILSTACNYNNKQLFQELKKRTMFNFRESKECSEASISKILCSFAQYDVVQSLQSHVDDKVSSNTNLTDNLLLFSYFPTLIFHQQSPQYIFYNKLSKEIDKVKEKMSQKWIAMSIFGISSAQYNNVEFIDDCVKQVLSNHENSENTNIEESLKFNQNLNELSMILFGYSNMKRSNEYSRKMIERIRDIFMQNKFNKATPIAWAQFFNALTNTNQEIELDEIEQQFAEVVYFDKIQSSIHAMTQNMLLSLLFSFSRLKIDQEILQEILSYININKLSNFQLYILNISIQLSGMQKFNDISSKLSHLSSRIKEVELFMKNTISSKLNFHGNQRFTYSQVNTQIKSIIYEIISNDTTNSTNINNNQIQNENEVIENYFDEELNIMIDFYLPQSKRGIFLYSYDNCLMQEYTDKKNISDNSLSGLFQAKENILINSRGISIHRIFIHEFNSIGLKHSIEEEKLLKKKYVQDILLKKSSE